jgi:calcineurin-like phosphoesterase family protein
MRYWTSDLHLGHRNIIEYCKRPFADREVMTSEITTYLLSVLKKGDELVVVGDVSLKPTFALELGRLLKAQGVSLVLVMGNHDSPHPSNSRNHDKLGKQRALYAEAGWDLHLHWETKLADGTFVKVSHMPYATPETLEYDKRYLDYRLPDTGSFLIHGHLHGKYKKLGRMVDVGYDPHEGKILSEDELIALIHSPEHRVDCHLTGHHAYRKENNLEKTDMKGL